jgi:hypothetical protein
MRKVIIIISILILLAPPCALATHTPKQQTTDESIFGPVLLFGSIKNVIHKAEGSIIFNAGNVRCLTFPLEYFHYRGNERFTIFDSHLGRVSENRIIGIFFVASVTDQGQHFPVYFLSNVTKLHWYNVTNKRDSHGVLTELTVSELQESIVNRTLNITYTYTLFNTFDEKIWTRQCQLIDMPPYYVEQWVAPCNTFTYNGSNVTDSAYAIFTVNEF